MPKHISSLVDWAANDNFRVASADNDVVLVTAAPWAIVDPLGLKEVALEEMIFCQRQFQTSMGREATESQTEDAANTQETIITDDTLPSPQKKDALHVSSLTHTAALPRPVNLAHCDARESGCQPSQPKPVGTWPPNRVTRMAHYRWRDVSRVLRKTDKHKPS